MHKLIMLATSGLLSLGLAAFVTPGPGDEPPPPPKKKKGEPGPAGDVRKAYDLLRRIKADELPEGRREDRLRDWTDRSSALYRKAVKAIHADDPRLAHEYGAAAHDLARAIDHARNASRFERPDPDLPPPPTGEGPEGDAAEVRRDLRHAYDRIQEADDEPKDDAKFYLDAARDLYKAARRDAQSDRHERAGELAKAAEAMTHVPEHIARAEDKDKPKAKKHEKADRPDEPKAKKGEKPDHDALPPPID